MAQRLPQARTIEDVVDVGRKLFGDPLGRRQRGNGRRRAAKLRPVPVLPGDVESTPILIEPEGTPSFAGDGAETRSGVDPTDPLDRRQLEAGLARIGEELKRAGADHRVVGNLPGCGQVALERRVLHELDIAKVGKPFASNRVGGGVDAERRRLDRYSRQVVYRVTILSAGQPTNGHLSRISCVAPGMLVDRPAHPVDHLSPPLLIGCRRPLRRHRLLLEDGDHSLPLQKMPSRRALLHQPGKAQPAFRSRQSVTGKAMLLENRLDSLARADIRRARTNRQDQPRQDDRNQYGNS